MKFTVSIALLLAASTASAYVPRTVGAVTLHRNDFANVQFYLNQNAVGGLSAGGVLMITPDSDPKAAVQAAMASWNSVATSSARFAPLVVSSAVNNPADLKNVIFFGDTPEVRSMIGGTLASTLYQFNPADGSILETDIIFDPTKTFSTTLAAGTYDLQSILTHELGHCLGANHTGILGAAMFQTTNTTQSVERLLKDDDIAFVTAAYPAASGLTGTLTGTVTAGGAPLRGVLVTAVDSTTGVAVDGLTDLTTGVFNIQVLPGNYIVYAEPLTGAVSPAFLYISATTDAGFQPVPAGGFAAPTVFPVLAGQQVDATFQAAAGDSTLKFSFFQTAAAGGDNDISAVYSYVTPSIVSGTSFDLVFAGPGMDLTLTESGLVLLGPAKIKAGSLWRYATVNGMPLWRVTVDSTALTGTGLVTMLVSNNGNATALTGGIVLLAAPPTVPTPAVTGLEQ